MKCRIVRSTTPKNVHRSPLSQLHPPALHYYNANTAGRVLECRLVRHKKKGLVLSMLLQTSGIATSVWPNNPTHPLFPKSLHPMYYRGPTNPPTSSKSKIPQFNQGQSTQVISQAFTLQSHQPSSSKIPASIVSSVRSSSGYHGLLHTRGTHFFRFFKFFRF